MDMNKHLDLANRSNNATGAVVAIGQELHQEYLLNSVIPKINAQKHRDRLCHIHDLEFYDLTYNCIGLHVSDLVKDPTLPFRRMLRQLHRQIIALTNRQSGGIGFINFDQDASLFLREESDDELIEAFRDFYLDLNMFTRKGCEKPYVTLNFGLDTSKAARRISFAMLEAFCLGTDKGTPFIFPNHVFKLSKQINQMETAPNHDLFLHALSVTAKRMIPTYYNCDSVSNQSLSPYEIGVMGCRTRMGNNINGKDGAFNRGNVACVTLNLVQMAYHAHGNLDTFIQELKQNLSDARDLLLHHYHLLCNQADFKDCFREGYYLNADKHDNEAMLKNGTLSIGFIGLWDALQILHGETFTSVDSLRTYQDEALGIIRIMRCFTDETTQATHLNFSLLASAAEGVTGKFAKFDSEHVGKGNAMSEKGFYTNSFHIPVNIPASYRSKAEIEGPFHKLCNGGSITYVEFKEMPNYNIEAVQEVVDYACSQDCNYIGINFKMDYCEDCGYTGRLNDTCPSCGGHHVKHLRRVSGYLAEESTFATGKKAEMKKRISHIS